MEFAITEEDLKGASGRVPEHLFPPCIRGASAGEEGLRGLKCQGTDRNIPA